LIIVDRPGYGGSSFHKNRTYQSFALDLYYVLKHFGLERSKSYFISHSAGTPHLLAFCYRYPDQVARATIVCPVNPLIGKVPIDRPQEPTCARSCQRCCVVHMLCCFSCCFSPILTKWQNDPKEFEKFSMKEMSTTQDFQFYEEHPNRKLLMTQHFGDAVQKPNGKNVLFQDMFELPTKAWGFRIQDLNCDIDVWYGDQDNAAPNGKWFVDTIPRAKGYEQHGYGHGLIYVKFDKIVEKLLK